MRRRFKCDPKWITVRHPAKCAEPNWQTQIRQDERAFYYPADKAVYGSRPHSTSTGLEVAWTSVIDLRSVAGSRRTRQ